MFTFGPIPSRRLGSSLGINHIPAKYCSYACVYCQAGRTTHLCSERREFFAPDEVLAALAAHLDDLKLREIPVDTISFVPDGEPALDIHLGELIIQAKRFGKPVAVFTNSTLLSDAIVRQELGNADIVSVKVDAVDSVVWKAVDRPHGRLDLCQILDGIRVFASEYKGRLLTETMLVKGLNDPLPHLEAAADFIAGLQPSISYLTIPTRPPMESWVMPPAEPILLQALAVFKMRIESPVELLCQGDPAKFAPARQFEESILAITAVHPMRREAVLAMLAQAGKSEVDLDHLLERGFIQLVVYKGEIFYRRSPLLG
jgi:wyosine [tRNA(Phe)-imidazoG37] synthetase (radical SAM superfamily)